MASYQKQQDICLAYVSYKIDKVHTCKFDYTFSFLYLEGLLKQWCLINCNSVRINFINKLMLVDLYDIIFANR